jgi:hypothetical protein
MSSPFRLFYTGEVLRRVDSYLDRLPNTAARRRLREALRVVNEQLATSPLTWGEPAYNLKYLGLIKCNAFHAMLSVEYCVDE